MPVILAPVSCGEAKENYKIMKECVDEEGDVAHCWDGTYNCVEEVGDYFAFKVVQDKLFVVHKIEAIRSRVELHKKTPIFVDTTHNERNGVVLSLPLLTISYDEWNEQVKEPKERGHKYDGFPMPKSIHGTSKTCFPDVEIYINDRLDKEKQVCDKESVEQKKAEEEANDEENEPWPDIEGDMELDKHEDKELNKYKKMCEQQYNLINSMQIQIDTIQQRELSIWEREECMRKRESLILEREESIRKREVILQQKEEEMKSIVNNVRDALCPTKIKQ